MSDRIEPAAARVLPRGLAVLLGAAGVVVLVAGARGASEFLAPVLLAATIAICSATLVTRLRERGWPHWAALVSTLVVVFAVIATAGYAIVWAITRFAFLLPSYSSRFTDLLVDVRDWAEDRGIAREQWQDLLNQVDYGKIASYATGLVTSVAGTTFTAFITAFLVAFMIADSQAFGRALDRAHESHPDLVDSLRQAAADTRTNMLVTAGFGLGLALVITLALWLLGVPGAAVWGVLTFVTNFVPNIGFVIRLVPPTLIALLDSGPGLALAVLVVFSAANILSENVLQPRVAGNAAGISGTVALISVVFWAFALGPIGAVLALPLTIFVKALLVDADPEARWLSPLLGGAREGEEIAGEEDETEPEDEPAD